MLVEGVEGVLVSGVVIVGSYGGIDSSSTAQRRVSTRYRPKSLGML